jgi:rRNA maturation endonuclease Nob1
LDTELTIVRPSDIVSAHRVSRKTNIPLRIVTDLLMELAYISSLDIRYIVFCDNDDIDMVHAFEFESRKELREFLLQTGSICPDCGSQLKKDDVRVAYVKKQECLI